jgi:type IV pilus assembly protein PilQ
VPQNEGLPFGDRGTEPQAFTGEKISLDFQDADINDILRLIAEVGKVNIIAGGDVQGKITTRMTDVPWDQALDVILKINGLAQERSGNIIRIAPLEKFTNERQERLKAMVTEVQAEPLVTRIVPANYAAAKDLRPNLEKLLSRRGTIIIDARTNTMIITDTQASLDAVLALIEKLDRPTPQVMIEARIVESSRNFTRELGIQLGLAFSQITDRTFPNRIDVRGGIPNATGGQGLAKPPAPANFLLDLPAAVASGGAIGFSLASIGGTILDAQLSAMESSGRGKIISSPKIATLDNTEAQIQSGRKIPVATVSAEGTRTEFVDASITLKVTPHVTPNDYIGMKITATKNEADFGNAVNGIPTITTREANTDMLIKDGDTVVIGGLYKRTISLNRAGIPGLSSIPILGYLFRKEQERDDSDELLIFLTPRIIRQEDATDKRRTALSQ